MPLRSNMTRQHTALNESNPASEKNVRRSRCGQLQPRSGAEAHSDFVTSWHLAKEGGARDRKGRVCSRTRMATRNALTPEGTCGAVEEKIGRRLGPTTCFDRNDGMEDGEGLEPRQDNMRKLARTTEAKLPRPHRTAEGKVSRIKGAPVTPSASTASQ